MRCTSWHKNLSTNTIKQSSTAADVGSCVFSFNQSLSQSISQSVSQSISQSPVISSWIFRANEYNNKYPDCSCRGSQFCSPNPALVIEIVQSATVINMKKLGHHGSGFLDTQCSFFVFPYAQPSSIISTDMLAC